MVTDRRLRKRYIAFEVVSEEKIDRKELIAAIHNCSKKLTQRNRLSLMLFQKNKGVVRCQHTLKEETLRLLNSINNIGGKKVQLRTVGTSGTIRKAKKYLDSSQN